MAKPIKDTPVLEGQDAVNFYAHLRDNKDKKVDQATLMAILESARRLNAILRPR